MSLQIKERILIVGNSGSGKSTFGKFLSKKLDLPLFHLDRYFWQPGWKLPVRDEWNQIVNDLIAKDKWIIEGNFNRTFKLRALRSDQIFFFNYPVLLCLFRAYKRVIKSKLKLEMRDDMADGCPEIWPDLEFLKFIALFNKETRPRMNSMLEEINFDKKNLIMFNSRKEFQKYLKNLNKTL